MKIALDYDGTYTADPVLWDAFIRQAQERGHNISIVTMRYPHEAITGINCPVVYTSRQAKLNAHTADIWIDDNPHFLFHGG